MSEQHVPTIQPPPPDGVALDAQPAPAPSGVGLPGMPGLTRRGFLRASAVTGVGVAAAAGGACTPGGAAWPYPPSAASPTLGPAAVPGCAASATPMASHDAGASPSPAASTPPAGDIPPGWTIHDVAARDKVRRYLGDLVKALPAVYPEPVVAKLADILGVEDGYPELDLKPSFVQVPQLVLNDVLDPLTPTIDGDVKVFNLTIDEMEWKIDELLPPVAAMGYNNQWPGPTIRVNQGDKVRAVFKNNLAETSSVHFHGVEFDDFFQDGVPFVTQLPITPGEEYAYDFVARNPGSLMYHSHHNATQQVGEGLLGAFIVDPPKPQVPYDREYIWISNDQLGGFTINGHGFPAVVPVLAAKGERVLVRFMNEGLMMHPWHSHGFAMDVVARDGIPLGSASFKADTLGVNPGERWDAVITADRLGVWAFHCHILSHVEGIDGMFGMVSTLIVVPEKKDVDAIISALLA
jgi:FtsP/CotA-like multicopper oxidase with cupredoxin domain